MHTEAQPLLPDYMHIQFIRGRADTSLSFARELRLLDSLHFSALDSLHKAYPWFSWSVVDSPRQEAITIPTLGIRYSVVSNRDATIRNIAMGTPMGAFNYTIQRETDDVNDRRRLDHSAEMMKDLEGYLQNPQLQGYLYKDIYRKLDNAVSTYVIDTRNLLPARKLAGAGITIKFQGINGSPSLPVRERLLINGIFNNILVAGQQHYSFNYIPSFLEGHAEETFRSDSLIKLALSITDSAGLVKIHLEPSAPFELVYHRAVDRNPLKMNGEVVRDFTIAQKDIVLENYSSLLFAMAKSLNKFFLLNIPPGK